MASSVIAESCESLVLVFGVVSILLSNTTDPVNIVRDATFQFLFPDNGEPPLPKYFQGVFHPCLQLEVLAAARSMVFAIMRD